MSVTSRARSWRVLAIVAALLFVYASVLVKLTQTWWADENYSHGLLIPFIIAYVVWSQRQRLFTVQANPSTLLGGAAVLLALFALWAGVAGAELYIQRLSLVLIVVGLVLYFAGTRLVRLIWMPLILLLLAIPIPAIVFNQIALPLQLFASRCAVWSMRFLDIPVLRQGNVIELLPLNAMETKKLEVVEACSGIRSLMTLITLAVVLAYFSYPSGDDTSNQTKKTGGFRREFRSWGLWRSIILVLSAIPIAIFTNALRVSGTGILAHYYGTEIADGFFHSFSGWLIYIVAFVLLISFAWLLDRVSSVFSKNFSGKRPALEQVNLLKPSPTQIPQPEGMD